MNNDYVKGMMAMIFLAAMILIWPVAIYFFYFGDCEILELLLTVSDLPARCFNK